MPIIVTIDGTDVTNVSVSGSWTRRLNRPSQAQVRIPMDEAVGDVGSRLMIQALIGTTYQIVFHGFVLLCETTADENQGYTVYNATDPMELWQWRPVRDDDCDYSLPQIIDTYLTGPQIVEAMLQNSEGIGGCSGADCIDSDAIDCEGPLFIEYGTFEGGGVDLSGAPTDWPMTIAELTSLLVSTGCLDVVLLPIDSGGNMAEVSAYNGDYGTDLSGSVLFQYGTGARNIRALRWNKDMSNLSNKIRYLAGPRCGTAADPAGDQHWCYSVGATHPTGIPDPIPNGAALSTLVSDVLSSRSTYGTRMEIQIFDAVDDDCCGNAVGSPGHDLYKNRWSTEQWIRKAPRELIHVTPTREAEIGTFDIGDLVGVEATAAVRGGFSGAQRVYEYTTAWEDDGVLYLSELQTSDTADA